MRTVSFREGKSSFATTTGWRGRSQVWWVDPRFDDIFCRMCTKTLTRTRSFAAIATRRGRPWGWWIGKKWPKCCHSKRYDVYIRLYTETWYIYIYKYICYNNTSWFTWGYPRSPLPVERESVWLFQPCILGQKNDITCWEGFPDGWINTIFPVKTQYYLYW